MRGWLGLAAISAAVLWAGCDGGDDGSESLEREPEVLEQLRGPRDAGAPRGGGALGSACSAASDCTGANAKCVTQLLILPIPGGYCSSSCANDRQCGTAGACPFAAAAGLAKLFLPDAGALADSASVCVKKCSTAADCREGYVCQALPQIPLILTSTAKFCIPPIGVGDGGIPLFPLGDGGMPRFPIPDGGFPPFPGFPPPR
jgi:hypothetical protein